MYTSINHNMMAANTARNLNSHYANLAASTQRLSSGLRINSAADDAAGLAIRELQRTDIAALHQGARNANDAISMIQVADGALGVIDEKLIRMKELAEQAATGTYDSTQRLMIDSEYQAMADEIDRIANATDFNGRKLLDGSRIDWHDGSGMESTGAFKIHFGPGNDAAEDYYFVQIGDCTAGALGVGKNSMNFGKPDERWIFEEGAQTFKPGGPYKIYSAPNGTRYYTDGDFFFSNPQDPVGSALDWTTDRQLIEKLRTENQTSNSYLTYTVMVDPQAEAGQPSLYYTRDGGRTYSAEPYNPGGKTLDPSVDGDIIARLKATGETAQFDTTWQVYEDPAGKLYYTCDNGLTYVPDKSHPADNLLDSRKYEHRKLIDKFTPVVQDAYVSLPSLSYDYKDYKLEGTTTPYWALYENGQFQYFVSDKSNPEGSQLESPKDDATINNLVEVQDELTSYKQYDIWTSPEGEPYYTEDGNNFFTLVNNQFIPVQQLPPNLDSTTKVVDGGSTYTVYVDANNKMYYSGDGGKTVFESLDKPGDTKPMDPAYAKVNTTVSISKPYKMYHHETYGVVYTCDDGATFVRNPKYGENIVLKADGSNESEIDKIKSNPVAQTLDYDPLPYYAYYDPQTMETYYTTTKPPAGRWNDDPNLSLSPPPFEDIITPGNNVEVAPFIKVLSPRGDVELEKDKDNDNDIIARLIPVQADTRITIPQRLPDVYYVYEDTQNPGEIYYKYTDEQGNEKITRYPGNPYVDSEKQDNYANLDLAERITTTRRIEYSYDGASIATQEKAQRALVAINNAIVEKDKIRAHLGALQNRLENTISNINIQAENLQAAESRISDVDVATEMTEFVRNQILTQSAVAMLGQANSAPQMLTQLLGGA